MLAFLIWGPVAWARLPDSVRVQELSTRYFAIKNVDTLEANRLIDQLRPFASSALPGTAKARALRTVAAWHGTYFRHEQELALLREALAMVESRSDSTSQRIKAFIHLDIGKSYFFQGNSSVALSHLFKVLQYTEAHGPVAEHLFFAYSLISQAYLLIASPADTALFAKGRHYAQLAMAHAYQFGNPTVRAYADLQRAAVLILSRADSTSTVDNLLRNVKATGEQLGNHELIGLSYGFTSLRYQLAGEYEKVLDTSPLALQEFGKIHGYLNYAEELIAMGFSLYQLHRYQEAERCFRRALAMSYGINCSFTKKNSLRLLVRLFETTGQQRPLLEFQRRYQHIADSLSLEDEQAQILVAETTAKAEQQQVKIALLEKERELQQLLLQQTKQSNAYLAIGAVASVLFGVMLMLYLVDRQKLIRQQADMHNQEIQKLERDKMLIAARAMLEGQEEERRRLARDVHDGLGSILSSVKHNLTATPGPVETELPASSRHRAVAMIDLSLKELRRVASNMTPEALQRFGLAEAVRDFCEMNTTDQLHIEFVSLLTEERFDPSKEIVAYRIIQELVTNAIKHARATYLLVQLTREEQLVTITVEDNGCGFDPKTLSRSSGSGWRNIQHRIEFLNGKADLNSNQEGTSVTIHFYV